MKTFTYNDSSSGQQGDFEKLSELIAHIESFEPKEDSVGTVYFKGLPILEYDSNNSRIEWLPVGDVD